MIDMGFFRCLKCGKPYSYNEIINSSVPRCSCGSVVEAVDILFEKNITMFEGNTPLIKKLGVYIMCEYVNPTGSFKDRGSAIEISQALILKKDTVVVASTGNMAASIAAYSAFAGLKCKVFIPNTIHNNKLKQIYAYGAEVIPIEGDYTVAMNLAEEYVRQHKNTFLAGDYVYRFEGTKEIGREIFYKISIPDYIIVPIGNGTIFCAIYKYFKGLVDRKLTSRVPKMIGVQAERCSPIYKAWKEDTIITPVQNPETIATALICGDPIYGDLVLETVKESGGELIIVTDDEIKSAQEIMGKNGFYVEVSGAVSYAGYLKKSYTGTIVILATGSGLKE